MRFKKKTWFDQIIVFLIYFQLINSICFAMNDDYDGKYENFLSQNINSVTYLQGSENAQINTSDEELIKYFPNSDLQNDRTNFPRDSIEAIGKNTEKREDHNNKYQDNNQQRTISKKDTILVQPRHVSQVTMRTEQISAQPIGYMTITEPVTEQTEEPCSSQYSFINFLSLIILLLFLLGISGFFIIYKFTAKPENNNEDLKDLEYVEHKLEITKIK